MQYAEVEKSMLATAHRYIPEHPELGRRQSNDTVGKRWPGKASALQDLVMEAETLFGRGSKTLDSLTHFRNAAGDIDRNLNNASIESGPIILYHQGEQFDHGEVRSRSDIW